MNLQQLEYIIAVDTHRHFAKAAEASFVTQPTLSMMIQKMEDELGVKLFDRSSHPIKPTAIGEKVIEQARITVRHFNQIYEVVQEERQLIKGRFNLAIIPTIAPYLIPNLLKVYEERSDDQFQLNIKEATTAQILEGLANGTLHGGILATPLNHDRIVEHPAYYEKFYAYVSPLESIHAKNKITLEEFEGVKNIWLLEDVHCFRNQILKMCQFNHKKRPVSAVSYEAGSIDTLINIIDKNEGATIIPELAAMELREDQQDNLRDFSDIIAVREVSLVVSQEFVRNKMLEAILQMIRTSIPVSMQNEELKEFVVEISAKKK